jgi:hypothetical protein
MASVDNVIGALTNNLDYDRSNMDTRCGASEFSAAKDGDSKVGTNVWLYQGLYGGTCCHLVVKHLTRLVVGEEHARIFHSILEAAAQSGKVDVTAVDIHCLVKKSFPAFDERFRDLHNSLTSGELEPNEADSDAERERKAEEKTAAETLEVYWGSDYRAAGALRTPFHTILEQLLGWSDIGTTKFLTKLAIDELHVKTHREYPCQLVHGTRMQAAQATFNERCEPTEGTHDAGTGVERAWLSDMASR